ncbi:hypothetical protein LRY65_05285 [Candidatus Woesebacteria bacterium]|nr:hypothetical protein [Candidatus Woesebacteria bacterium]MCD8507335.1 hypothetical protein [Candidatus Woesebacteria bacterium]MCD8527582.1 hypothetical protein [Candidatus Woesebacteria bacterium]
MSQSAIQTIATEFRPPITLQRQPQVYSLLGETLEDQAKTIAKEVIAPEVFSEVWPEKREIYEYIALFLRHSTFTAPVNGEIGKGRNLAKRAYLAPTGFRTTNQDGEELPDFFYFAEQYRWDTFFHNQLFTLIGMNEMAIDQLLNLVDVFYMFSRIPNALTTEFLSHPQPPIEALSARDLLENGASAGEWYDTVMNVVEAELYTEWWDYRSGRVYPRQNQDFMDRFGPYLSRYVSIHMHPLIVGCQDGKDHNWISAYYGENYIPVQLNCLLWANVRELARYYREYRPNPGKAELYETIQQELAQQMQQLFWVNNGRWRGFRNYSLGTTLIHEGPILYGDLAAEIFPLYVGLATREQAEITLANLKEHYEGDIGLAATSPSLREDGSIPRAPEGFVYQWEYNAWPPLMILAVEALEKYSQSPDDDFATYASSLRLRWIQAIEHEFLATKNSDAFHGEPAMHEKYPYSTHIEVKPGFYGNLRGFGWTVASYLQFVHQEAQRDFAPSQE